MEDALGLRVADNNRENIAKCMDAVKLAPQAYSIMEGLRKSWLL